jgi:hypothetical protein
VIDAHRELRIQGIEQKQGIGGRLTWPSQFALELAQCFQLGKIAPDLH